MATASKPSVGVRDVRAIEQRRAAALAAGAGGGGHAPVGVEAAVGRPGEASLHDKYAELRASGLACDRW